MMGNKKKNIFKKYFLWYSLIILAIVIVFGLVVHLVFNKTTKGGVQNYNIGTFGDMYGVLNALFSGLAFAGIIYTILLQKKELKLQRKELKLTRKEFKTQNKTLRLQRFENTFFQMLNLHHEIIDKISRGHGVTKKEKREAIEEIAGSQFEIFNSLIQKRNHEGNDAQYIGERYKLKSMEDFIIVFHKFNETFYNSYFKFLNHYFRNLYHIFKYIYISKLDDKEKQFYASLVCAQLSQAELSLIFYNSLVEGLGKPNMLFLIKEFDILKNLDRTQIKEYSFHNEYFESELEKVKNPFV